MNKKKVIIILMMILLLMPTFVFADDYSTIQNVANTLLSALSWIGYAISLRNYDIHRNKICFKWSK